MALRGRDGDGNGVQNWRHGWIPITPRAAFIKAKGRRGLAERIMRKHGIEDRRKGGDRREGSDAKKALERGSSEGTYRTPGEDRGTGVYRRGTKTVDYPDRKPGQRYTPAGADRPSDGKGMTPEEAFKKKGPELREAAAKGDKGAQAELERREVKRAAKGKPAAEKPAEGPLPWRESNPEAPKRTPQKPLAEAGDSELAREVYRRGGTVGSDGKYRPGTAARDLRPGDRNPELEWHSDEDIARELHRRGGAVDRDGNHIPGGSAGTKPGETSHKAPETATQADLPAFKEAVKREDEDILRGLQELAPAVTQSHRVSGIVGRDFRTGDFKVVGSYHYDHEISRYNEVGKVTQGSDGKWYAKLYGRTAAGNRSERNDQDLGPFADRKSAHTQLGLFHEVAKSKEADRKSASAERARKKADTVAEKRRELAKAIVGTEGPNGTTWQVHEVGNDGTSYGAAAAAKVKQAYQAGDKTVLIEIDADVETTKRLLRDITLASELAGPNLPAGVKFRVPSGDRNFGPSSTTGGYVMYGDKTVHISPRFLDEAEGTGLHDIYRRAAERGGFTPAGKSGSVMAYTITHELGHVIDGQARHTRPAFGESVPTVSFGKMGGFRADNAVWSRQNQGHSTYGASNPAEGYAEAFAQWTLGGPGSHRVSDAYAERFGWKAPGSGKFADTERTRRTNQAAAVKRQQDIEARKANEILEAAKANGTGVMTELARRIENGRIEGAKALKPGDKVVLFHADGGVHTTGRVTGKSADGKYLDVVYGNETTPRRVWAGYAAADTSTRTTHLIDRAEIRPVRSVKVGDVKAGDTWEPIQGNGRGTGYSTKVAKVDPLPDGGKRVTFADGTSREVAAGEELPGFTRETGEVRQTRRTKADTVREAREKYGNGSPEHIRALMAAQGRKR